MHNTSVLAILAAASVSAALEPVWTNEAAFGTESLAHVGFTSEDTIVYITNVGMVGWLDARNGKLVKFGRVGQQIVSGTSLGDRIWLRGPTNDLIEIEANTAEIIQVHRIGKDMDLRISDGSPYVLRSRFDKPIEVLSLPSLKSEFTVPKDAGNWTAAASRRTNRVAVVIYQNLTIWDAVSGKQLHSQRLPLGDVMDIRFTPDDKQLAITYPAWAGTILYDAKTMKRLAGVKGTFYHPDFAHHLNAIISKGYYDPLPRLSVPGTSRSWSLPPGESARAAAFSPSDRLLALARKGTVSVYRVPRGLPRR